jgi:hypothetical protein
MEAEELSLRLRFRPRRPDLIEFSLHLGHALKLNIKRAVNPVDDPPALVEKVD